MHKTRRPTTLPNEKVVAIDVDFDITVTGQTVHKQEIAEHNIIQIEAASRAIIDDERTVIVAGGYSISVGDVV